jgi:hypothetical protein
MANRFPRMECRPVLGAKPVIAFVGILAAVFAAFMLPRVVGILAGGLTFGAVMVWFVNEARARLVIDNTGIAIRRPLGGSAMAWDEIAYYRVWSQIRDEHQDLGVNVIGGGILTALVVTAVRVAVASTATVVPKRLFAVGQLTLVATSGRRFAITPDFQDLTPALDLIFAQLHARLRTDDDHEAFTVTERALEHSTGSVRYSEIETVELVLGSLAIRKRGDRKALTLGTHKVRNLMVFLDKLVARGVKVTNRDAFVPMPPTWHAQSPEALPIARVVLRWRRP